MLLPFYSVVDASIEINRSRSDIYKPIHYIFDIFIKCYFNTFMATVVTLPTWYYFHKGSCMYQV